MKIPFFEIHVFTTKSLQARENTIADAARAEGEAQQRHISIRTITNLLDANQHGRRQLGIRRMVTKSFEKKGRNEKPKPK
jgi:hypothetical protein